MGPGGQGAYAYSTSNNFPPNPNTGVALGRKQTTLGRAPTRRIVPGANTGIANAGQNIQRGRTLIRPDRYQEPPPLLTGKSQKSRSWFDPWVALSRIVTFWAMPSMLAAMKMPDPGMQQAWREKITLCFLIACLGGLVAFITIGVSSVLCPPDQSDNKQNFASYNDTTNSAGLLGIHGWQFNVSAAKPAAVDFYSYVKVPGTDITNFFTHGADIPSCLDTGNTVSNSFAAVKLNPCSATGCVLGAMTETTFNTLGITNSSRRVGFDWNYLASENLTSYFVIDGNVLNMEPYLKMHPHPIPNDALDGLIRDMLNSSFAAGGRDATKMFQRRPEFHSAMSCLMEKYKAGYIDKQTPGCFASQLILYFALGCVLSIVFARFFMALIFAWFISRRLSRTPPPMSATSIQQNQSMEMKSIGGGSVPGASRHLIEVGNDLYTVMLITAYSENTEGIRGTVESLSMTDYPDNRKLLFVIADGIITGHGETMTTPDMCLGLMTFSDPSDRNVEPREYIAVANGAKMYNRAKVYAGHYVCKGHKVPMILVVKCGNPDEDGKPKAGNRGKRDSQLILMNFFSRVTYNDRMTPLDYELFQKIQKLMNATPDYFELCLMVDADTKVYQSSLRLLVNCMVNDNLIMGLCGETKIANKRASWVSAIQVYEYFISHHLAKGFESVFGGVTCLPGCFCMYRLKARKGDGDWVPIITKPEIVQEYSSNTIDTLHQKNLLLLGEDRFLTTLMLRNFPYRKMTFTPQAICKTIVPDEFKVLLSQRRRWINSTIHNLFELVLVRNLCGTFCFSMQFVVMMDLIGTLTLPVAIVLTVVLVVSIASTQITSFQTAVPLVLLLIVLFSPAVLIFLTTHKYVYVLWMIVYLFALPIWNFVLPVYSYWHFDDFSWGETRKVEGETKGDGHGNADGVFDPSSVPLKRWEDYERKRVRANKRRERKERQMREMGPVHLVHSMVPGDEEESKRGLLADPFDNDDAYSSRSDVSSQDPMGYFDPTKEAPARAGQGGYYPSFRPQNDGPGAHAAPPPARGPAGGNNWAGNPSPPPGQYMGSPPPPHGAPGHYNGF
ncbi:chitin synthase-domain-containing protein [Dichotomocladium elegans]|nr:chitin synthase-domain-containing protein [Dichotomocladium elegans]